MSEFDKQSWIGRARELLDDSAQALDAATLSRLNRARQAALGARRARRLLPGWAPALGFACSALLLAIVLWPQRHGEAPPSHVPAVAADADFASPDDSIEFYQNLDFYAWLDAQYSDIDG
jgi:hypothetical protein